MKYISFTWGDNKNNSNILKHKVSFEEAKTVFFDDNAIEFFDTIHSDFENRYLILGLSHKPRLLVVSYPIKNDSSIIRIISARKSTKNEAKYYPGG